MTGRPLGYTEVLKVTMRPETAAALSALSLSTGLSSRHLVRLALDRYLVDLGLLLPTDLVPTRAKPKDNH